MATRICSSFPIASKRAFRIEEFKRLIGSLDHGLFGFPNPDAGIVELLVGFVLAVRITHLRLQVAMSKEKRREPDKKASLQKEWNYKQKYFTNIDHSIERPENTVIPEMILKEQLVLMVWSPLKRKNIL